MLISFQVENFLSFRKKVKFDLFAGLERNHSDHLARIKKYNLKILPIAGIYGSNASGKSNLCKAIFFAQRLILEGRPVDSRIPFEPFRLDPSYDEKPSTFIFELLINDECYEYGFKILTGFVQEEWLKKITKSSERDIFRRNSENIKLPSDVKGEEAKFLQYVFKGTRKNQLFLTNSLDQQVERFRSVYDWFKNQLLVISPESRFSQSERLTKSDDSLYEFVNDKLFELDTGIIEIAEKEVLLESLPLSKTIEESIKSLKIGEKVGFAFSKSDRYIFKNTSEGIKACRLVSNHNDLTGKKVAFELNDESDGTLRLLDLLPAFHVIFQKTSSFIVVIDELDRSLHTVLLRKLLQDYLESCGPNSRSQLIYTTHNVNLMDQALLRRDEMWILNRNNLGESDLYSLNDFKEIRKDKDIQKSYLEGRMGGIPGILFVESLK